MKELNALLRKIKVPASWTGMQPARDWFIVLALSLSAIIGSVVWNTLFFTNALNDKAAPGEEMLPTQTPESTLPTLETSFDERAQLHTRYESASFVDPSL